MYSALSHIKILIFHLAWWHWHFIITTGDSFTLPQARSMSEVSRSRYPKPKVEPKANPRCPQLSDAYPRVADPCPDYPFCCPPPRLPHPPFSIKAGCADKTSPNFYCPSTSPGPELGVLRSPPSVRPSVRPSEAANGHAVSGRRSPLRPLKPHPPPLPRPPSHGSSPSSQCLNHRRLRRVPAGPGPRSCRVYIARYAPPSPRPPPSFLPLAL